MEDMTTVGLIVTLLIFAAREVFAYLSKKSLQDQDRRLNELAQKMEKLSIAFKEHDQAHETSFKQVKELHEWHAKEDADGVKIWYIRQSLEMVLAKNANALEILAKNSETQVRILEEILDRQKSIYDRQSQILTKF
jgi:septal ring factor EnvC (AmiA/AmiB activator)